MCVVCGQQIKDNSRMNCTIIYFEYELLLVLGRVEELNCTSIVVTTFFIV